MAISAAIVQFTQGRFGSADDIGVSYASNDMETETAGVVTALTHQTNSGDVTFSNARFGTLGASANFAGNDMESMTVGTITILSGAANNGDCTFTDASSRFGTIP